MMNFLQPLLFFIALNPILATAQCNGHSELCDKHYNEVAYLTTHNAFNAGDDGFQLPNQNHGLTLQLQNGVRGFMLDVYDLLGTATVYHGTPILGTAPLADNLNEIKAFLDANPNQVVTIIFESYVDAGTMQTEFSNVGLLPYLHEQTVNTSWPTLQEMIDAGRRLVVFSDVDDAAAGQGWYHYVWDFAVETDFTNNSPSDFSCQFNRGDSINDLFILNHFVTEATLGIGQSDQATIVNAYDFFYPRAVQCWNEKQKFPNFPTVDFYELGETKRAVDSLNLSSTVGVEDISSVNTFQIFSGAEAGTYRIKWNELITSGQMKIRNSLGQTVQSETVSKTDMVAVDLTVFEHGLYLVSIEMDGGKNVVVRLAR